MQASVPRDTSPDSSLNLLREGYRFISNRCRDWDTDLFEASLLGERVVCMTGAEAARVFYDSSRFIRSGAVPGRVLRTLMGRGGVQTLDDEAHRKRKQLFLAALAPAEVGRLKRLFEETWTAALGDWQWEPELRLFDEVQLLLCCAACRWLGLPLDKERRLARDCGAMVDAFGAVGPRHWRGRFGRLRSEHWLKKRLPRLQDSSVAGQFRDSLPDEKTAVVEILNLLRPIVAIATYITFTALALYRYGREDVQPEWFVQEVRRFYPFTPLLGARVRSPFDWAGYAFEENQLVLLDVYGIDHDPRLWTAPDEFRPERFREQRTDWNFVPQGGGRPETGHRCAGEAVTVELMKVGYDFLRHRFRYAVPEQDLSFSLRRMPTLPRSRFVIQPL